MAISPQVVARGHPPTNGQATGRLSYKYGAPKGFSQCLYARATDDDAEFSSTNNPHAMHTIGLDTAQPTPPDSGTLPLPPAC